MTLLKLVVNARLVQKIINTIFLQKMYNVQMHGERCDMYKSICMYMLVYKIDSAPMFLKTSDPHGTVRYIKQLHDMKLEHNTGGPEKWPLRQKYVDVSWKC